MSTSCALASVRPTFGFGLTLVGCSRSSSSSPGMSSFELRRRNIKPRVVGAMRERLQMQDPAWRTTRVEPV